MLMRLARQTFVRQYGEFTYLFGKVTAFDQMFRSSEPFFAHITRQPKERDIIIDEIVRDYADVPREMVAKDFDELFAPLIAQKVILVGESAAFRSGIATTIRYIAYGMSRKRRNASAPLPERISQGVQNARIVTIALFAFAGISTSLEIGFNLPTISAKLLRSIMR